MDSNGMLFSNELAIAFLALMVFGILYNVSIEKWPWLAQLRSAEQVVIGVIVTVSVSSLFIGWTHATVVFIMFAASGLPMLIGSWVRSARDAQEAKKISKDTLQ